MKRLIGILLVVLVVFGFVACDSDNPSPSGSAAMPADENVLAVFQNVMGDLGQLFGSRGHQPLPSPDAVALAPDRLCPSARVEPYPRDEPWPSLLGLAGPDDGRQSPCPP